MDPEQALFLETAGSTLTTLVVTDAWRRCKEAVSALCRRVAPGDVAATEAGLDETRARLLAARAETSPSVGAELAAYWQATLRQWFESDPSAVAVLRREFAEAAASLHAPAQPTVGSIRLSATAKGHGRVYQAGRDQHITEQGPA